MNYQFENLVLQRAPKASTAYLWYIFLGGIGAHRFYLGSTLWGLLIVLAWIVGLTAAPVLLLFVAGILIFDLFAIPSLVRQRTDEIRKEVAQQHRADGMTAIPAFGSDQ